MNTPPIFKLLSVTLSLIALAVPKAALAETCSTATCITDAFAVPGNHSITLLGSITLDLTASGPLNVTGNVTVSANDDTLTVSGASAIFSVNPGAKLKLNQVILTNTSGLAISNNGGTVTLNDSTVTGCMNSNAAIPAGGIYNQYPGTLTLNSSSVVSNTVLPLGTPGLAGGGGGIFNSGTLTLNSSTVNGNTTLGSGAGDSGGGIFNAGTLTMNSSTATGNSATYGGGLVNFFGATAVLNSTQITGNTTVANPGTNTLDYGTITAHSSTYN